MLSTKSTLKSRKRKKAVDMPDSPPKRVTRARAKATAESKVEPKTTKITTASALIAAENKVPAEPAKSIKRKTRADDTAKAPVITAKEKCEAIEAPEKPRGRPKKTAAATKIYTPAPEIQPKSRTRTVKTAEVDGNSSEVAKVRGRSKKPSEAAVGETVKTKETAPNVEVVKKTARGRTAAAKAPQVEAPVVAKPVRPAKKVTFQEDAVEDKENLPLASKIVKKNGTLSTGLRAKPVRKPPIPRGTTRGKKASDKTEGPEVAAKDKPVAAPLSPKKVTQVAKSSSVSSEDELGGDRTRGNGFSKSPIKVSISIVRAGPKITSGVDSDHLLKSPTKASCSMIMASPARRPPPSPFKDALKETPRKVAVGGFAALSAPACRQIPFKDAWKETPRKAPVLASLMEKSAVKSMPSALKSSLLQTPARRPVSPHKSITTGSPEKKIIKDKAVDGETIPKSVSASEIPDATPQTFTSSPLRAAKPAQSSARIHTMTPAEQKLHNEVNYESKPDVSSVVEPCSFQTASPSSENPTMPALENPDSHTVHSVINHSASPNEQGRYNMEDAFGMTPPGNPSGDAPDVGRIYTGFRSVLEDPYSDSEDELQSTGPQQFVSLAKQNSIFDDFRPIGTPTPARLIKASTPVASIERATSRVKPFTIQTSDVSMTPLAVQLSSWLASSPEKKTSTTVEIMARGLVSPAGPTRLPQPDRKSLPVFQETPVESTYFDDEMVIRDQEVSVSIEGVGSDEYCDDRMLVEATEDSQESDQYGDENAVPTELLLNGQGQQEESLTETCTPARVFRTNLREIYTVSKVPLRPAAEESPLRVSRKRSRSVGPLSVLGEAPGLHQAGAQAPIFRSSANLVSSNVELEQQINSPKPSFGSETLPAPCNPSGDTWSCIGSPVRSIRKGADAQILRGAIVYVDVHTTEGADASGIFVELLTAMGAKCCKTWSWNPRASSGSLLEQREDGRRTSAEETVLGPKVGITHVVYKDGSKRTLEKVRESKGLVLCVGVGWVLE